QANVSESPSGSLDALPSRKTVRWIKTVWSGPAFATGGRLTSTTVQVKAALPLSEPSEAVTVTLNARGGGGLGGCATAVKSTGPVINPLVGVMLSPGGKPLALKVRVSPSRSLAVTASETAWPSEVVWEPGLVTTGGWSTSSTVQVKVTLLLRVPAEAVTVTL